MWSFVATGLLVILSFYPFLFFGEFPICPSYFPFFLISKLVNLYCPAFNKPQSSDQHEYIVI